MGFILGPRWPNLWKSQDLRTSGRLPLSSRVSDCLATPLALASSWKSKGAARRIVKDKGSGLIKPIETHRKRADQCKELEDSDAAKQRSPGPVSRQGRARRRNHLSYTMIPPRYWLFSAPLS